MAHNVQTVYIVGGTGAGSAAVAAQVQALNITVGTSTTHPAVIRLGGADRYATNNVVDIFASSGVGPNALWRPRRLQRAPVLPTLWPLGLRSSTRTSRSFSRRRQR